MHLFQNKVDFYITNVCNLTCQRCNRFNNHDFKGWQRWSDYYNDYQKWSQLVELKSATIMGGEPFLNPTIGDWIQGINTLFEIEIQVLTNGTRFAHAKHLYPMFFYRGKKSNFQNHIGVSLHNPNDFESVDADIRRFLEGTIILKPKGQNDWNSDWQYMDSNGVMINVYISDQFGPASILEFSPGQFTLHNSDPEMAHRSCNFANFKSYHFIRGKLYKCGPVALFPEFDQQFSFNISTEDRELINSYQPLTPENYVDYHQEFFKNLDNPLPQCKFCPTYYNPIKINPVRKGLEKLNS